jgi:DNA-directed RNA polymerase subunit RPC12/RpoP
LAEAARQAAQRAPNFGVPGRPACGQCGEELAHRLGAVATCTRCGILNDLPPAAITLIDMNNELDTRLKLNDRQVDTTRARPIKCGRCGERLGGRLADKPDHARCLHCNALNHLSTSAMSELPLESGHQLPAEPDDDDRLPGDANSADALQKLARATPDRPARLGLITCPTCSARFPAMSPDGRSLAARCEKCFSPLAVARDVHFDPEVTRALQEQEAKTRDVRRARREIY